MAILRPVAFWYAMGMTLLTPLVAAAQNYPSKTIRVVTSTAGGAIDFVARVVAQGLSGNIGQQAIVDNRPSGVIPGDTVAKSAPDGYTLLVAGESLWVTPLLSSNVPYDPLKDFAPVVLATDSPNLLVVHPSLPVKSVKDLIALAKAKPGALNYGSGTVGGSPHLSGELFKSMAGIKVVQVPYRGVGPALNALVGGEVDFMLPAVGAAMPHLKSGRLKGLAIASARPSELAPGLPTVAATGLPGYEAASMFCVFAPTGTPAPVIERLNREIRRDLNSPGMKERLFNSGMEIVGSSPEELAAAVRKSHARFGKVIRESGIRLD